MCRKLSWEAATERLLDVGSIKADEWPSAAERRYTAALWRMFRSIVGEYTGEQWRIVCALQGPDSRVLCFAWQTVVALAAEPMISATLNTAVVVVLLLPPQSVYTPTGFTALREALGMTSTTGLDEPELSESSESDEDEAAPQHHHHQQQQQPTAQPSSSSTQQPQAPAAPVAVPALPPRNRDMKERAKLSEEAKAARAQEAQAAVLQARSMGGPADWDLDWLTDPAEVLRSRSAPPQPAAAAAGAEGQAPASSSH